MTVEELDRLTGSHKKTQTLYNTLYDHIIHWLGENNMNFGSENTAIIMEEIASQVTSDISESWYRQSLGKTYYH